MNETSRDLLKPFIGLNDKQLGLVKNSVKPQKTSSKEKVKGSLKKVVEDMTINALKQRINSLKRVTKKSKHQMKEWILLNRRLSEFSYPPDVKSKILRKKQEILSNRNKQNK